MIADALGLGEDEEFLPNVRPDHIHLRFRTSMFANGLASTLGPAAEISGAFFSSSVTPLVMTEASAFSVVESPSTGLSEGGEGGGGIRRNIRLARVEGYCELPREVEGKRFGGASKKVTCSGV